MASRLLFSRLAGRLAASCPSIAASGAAKGGNLLGQLWQPLPLRVPAIYSTNFRAPFHREFTSNASQPSNEGDKAAHDGSDGKNEVRDESVETNKSSGNSTSSQDAEDVSNSQGSAELSDKDINLTEGELLTLLSEKDEEIKEMKDKVLRTYAEMENMIERQRRDSENSKKFAIQSFSKSLLDVADNLNRALSVVNESLSKIDSSQDSQGAVQILKNLLAGIEMTDKQLQEVFRKFGIQKFDPLNENFDPNRHNAVFQMPDDSKPPGTVAAVLKVGYMLHDRVLRPAEVGVTQDSGNQAADSADSDKKAD